MRAKITLSLNNATIAEHPLQAEVTNIGRRPGSDIQIENAAVSGRHARILLMGNQAFIEDLESTNGTFINGQKVAKQMLQAGDRITIGQHLLTYEVERDEGDDTEKPRVVRPYAIGLEGPTPVRQPEPAPVKKETEGRSALLQLMSGPNEGKKMALDQSITRLGKPGEQVAAIARRPQGYFIMHLGGDTPQPVVNGAKVSTQAFKLKHGDVIEVGKVQMKILIPDAT